jgi:hypothetical protein
MRSYPNEVVHFQQQTMPPTLSDQSLDQVGRFVRILKWIETDPRELDPAQLEKVVQKYGFVPRMGIYHELAMPDGRMYSRSSASIGEHVHLVRAFGFTPRQLSGGRYPELEAGADSYMGRTVLGVQLSVPAIIAAGLGLIGSAVLAAGISRTRGRRHRARGFAVVQPETRSGDAFR